MCYIVENYLVEATYCIARALVWYDKEVDAQPHSVIDNTKCVAAPCSTTRSQSIIHEHLKIERVRGSSTPTTCTFSVDVPSCQLHDKASSGFSPQYLDATDRVTYDRK